jgi:hypothetical protein
MYVGPPSSVTGFCPAVEASMALPDRGEKKLGGLAGVVTSKVVGHPQPGTKGELRPLVDLWLVAFDSGLNASCRRRQAPVRAIQCIQLNIRPRPLKPILSGASY